MNPNRITILVLEDDPLASEEIREILEYEQYKVYAVEDAESFALCVAENSIDLFLMDLMLPDGNGLALVKQVRQTSNAGIIIISGRTSETDRVVGLEVGADDYISKPFSGRELSARVASVLRRTSPEGKKVNTQSIMSANNEEVSVFDGWKLHHLSRNLLNPDGEEVYLTKSEFDILAVFLRNKNRVLTRDSIISKIKGRDWAGYDRSVDGLITRLRKKVSPEHGKKSYFKTIQGIGYMFPDL
ncbi:MAG: response regulator transcription factor [Paracoccaceae bacterium]